MNLIKILKEDKLDKDMFERAKIIVRRKKLKAFE